jgi:hypothetical protein
VKDTRFRIAVKPFPSNAMAGRRCPSQWRPERLRYVVGKRVDHSAFVITLVCPEEPAINERVDLGAVKFDHKAAKAGPTSRQATAHSICGGFSCNNGFCRYIVNRRLAHRDVLSDRFSALLYHTEENGAGFCGKHVKLCYPNARRLRCTLLSFSYGYAFPVSAVYGCQLPAWLRQRSATRFNTPRRRRSRTARERLMIEHQRRCFGTPPPVSTLVMGGRRRRRGAVRFCWQQPD